MEIAAIIILALAIVVASIIRAFGKVVEAGGNLSKSISELKEADGIYIKNETARKDRKSQIFRTIGGVLFGVLLLCPILYEHRENGAPFVNIDHQVRDFIVGFLVVSEVLVILIIWIVDRKLQK